MFLVLSGVTFVYFCPLSFVLSIVCICLLPFVGRLANKRVHSVYPVGYYRYLRK